MYLYIFKNSTSNKQYIGYTESDIKTYLGSGKYWKAHCKKHGGYDHTNIIKVWYEWFDDKSKALNFLDDFERQHPHYWESDEWCNLVRENLETSPFKDNMTTIFEMHGNPFTGGEIQRRAHAEGKHNYDRSETGRKSWSHGRCRETAAAKMQEGYQKWKEENYDQFLANQREKNRKSVLKCAQRIVYNGELYIGWNHLLKETGVSKYKFKKYNLGQLL